MTDDSTSATPLSRRGFLRVAGLAGGGNRASRLCAASADRRHVTVWPVGRWRHHTPTATADPPLDRHRRALAVSTIRTAAALRR
ncbi:MAG: hypothetical protein KatS3mg060_1773 [Dehalococcoidia bacterium]|nr:MAG: hypothetical protein KatS3mg060_1773 [Dehalococcoidia bacterium]